MRRVWGAAAGQRAVAGSTINFSSDSKEPCPKLPLPVGYVYGEQPGSVLIDPDQEVRRAVELIFELFRQTGSAYGVVRHFAQHQLRFPKRAYGGIWNGKLLWGTLKHGRVLGVLNNPCYAGAYVFGRHRCSKSLSTDGQLQSRVQRQPIDSWSVLIQDHHAASVGRSILRTNRFCCRTKPTSPSSC